MRCCIEGQPAVGLRPAGRMPSATRPADQPHRIGWACVWPGSRTAAFRRPSARWWAPLRWAALNIVPGPAADFEIRLPGMRPEAVTGRWRPTPAADCCRNAPGRRERHPVSAVATTRRCSAITVRLRPLAGAVVRQRSVSTVAFGTEGDCSMMGVATLVCRPGSMARGHKADGTSASTRPNAAWRCWASFAPMRPAEPLT